MRISILSTIPVAAGLGSGAAVSVSILRALFAYLGYPVEIEQINSLAYEIEKRHHGTPSGIDNTVITYEQPIFFQRGQPIEFIKPAQPLFLVIADTGIKSPTSLAVGGVRERWQEQQEVYESLFDKIGQISLSARLAMETGDIPALGKLMNQNHEVLRKIGVSCLELDRLCASALVAGALGAKLSGGGEGGNMIALVIQDEINPISEALLRAGAVRTYTTHITP